MTTTNPINDRDQTRRTAYIAQARSYDAAAKLAAAEGRIDEALALIDKAEESWSAASSLRA